MSNEKEMNEFKQWYLRTNCKPNPKVVFAYFMHYHISPLESELSQLREENTRLKSFKPFDEIPIGDDLVQHYKNALAEVERLKALQFCSCDSEIKTGWTSAKHCNICGKLEKEETWLKQQDK